MRPGSHEGIDKQRVRPKYARQGSCYDLCIFSPLLPSSRVFESSVPGDAGLDASKLIYKTQLSELDLSGQFVLKNSCSREEGGRGEDAAHYGR